MQVSITEELASRLQKDLACLAADICDCHPKLKAGQVSKKSARMATKAATSKVNEFFQKVLQSPAVTLLRRWKLSTYSRQCTELRRLRTELIDQIGKLTSLRVENHSQGKQRNRNRPGKGQHGKLLGTNCPFVFFLQSWTTQQQNDWPWQTKSPSETHAI